MASIYQDWMHHLIKDDDDPASPQEQAAFLSYLDGETTADEAAHECTKQVTESEDRSAVYVWSLLIDAAEEFPQAHQKLLELLDAVKRMPAKGKDTARKPGGDLGGFLCDLCDAFNGIQSAAQSSHSTLTTEHHYINLCAFIARLWHHQHGEWANWALELCSDGLEDEHCQPLTNLFGQAVAQVFLYSGAEMYALSHATACSDYAAGPLLQKATRGGAVSRWAFWKQRICQLKASGLSSQEVGQLLSTVLDRMIQVEAERG